MTFHSALIAIRFVNRSAPLHCHRPQLTNSRYTVPWLTLSTMIGSVPPPEFRILIVDDDPAIRGFLRRGLRLEGYDVIEATSGEDAVALTRDARPDLLVLDWMMPGMDGPEILRRVRASGSGVPVIFFSGRDGGREQGLALGAQEYLEKPGPFSRLVASLHALLPTAGQSPKAV